MRARRGLGLDLPDEEWDSSAASGTAGQSPINIYIIQYVVSTCAVSVLRDCPL